MPDRRESSNEDWDFEKSAFNCPNLEDGPIAKSDEPIVSASSIIKGFRRLGPQPTRREPLTKAERDELREETEAANAAFHERGVWCNDYETLLRLLDQVEALEERLSKTHIDHVEMGKKGGAARAKALTPERRSEIARTAATARWNK
ncbi:hypothetical protein LCGC14_1674400 [marine sediment metagenome]|uniref:Uncharacterized protein n=1 Tax=marine sediment metagenome TaxID=412755 RepID=A0A0F9HQI2_9ZZZZ